MRQRKELDRFATSYRKDMQIQTKLLLMFAGFILLACILVAGVSLFIFNYEVELTTKNGLMPTADGVIRTLYDWRSCIDGYAAIYSRDKEISAAAAQNDRMTLARLMEARLSDTDTDFYAVTDSAGRIIWSHDVAADDVSSVRAVSSALSGKRSWSFDQFSNCTYAMVAAAPLFDGGRVVGSIVLGYSLVNNLLVEQVKESYGAECTVFKEDLRVDTSLLDENGKKITGTRLTNKEISEQVLQRGVQYLGRNEITGKKYVSVYIPLAAEDGIIKGMLFVAKSLESITSIIRTATMLIVPFALILAVILSFFGYVFVHWLMWRIKNVSDSLKDMATGEADLTKRCKLFIRDEIGFLVIHFDSFCDKLQEIVSEIKGTKGDLLTYGDRLGTMVQENATFVEQMIGNIKNVETEIENQNKTIGNTVESVGEISGSVNQLRKLLATQKQGVENASSAVTQMIGNIDSVSRSIEKMASEFDELQRDVGDGIARQREVSEQISKIEQQSKMLNDANAVISSIAGQTSLLAMNAAIEAAHAGDAGKGFAVVADEIRKLSEDSSAQSKNIGNQLKMILGSISNVVISSGISDKMFVSVSEKIQDTGDLVTQIKASMDEQSEGSKQISEALGYMNDATNQVRDASDDVDVAQQKIGGEVEILRKSAEVVVSSMNSMEKSVKDIEEGDNSLMNIATSISGSIYRINNQIDQFKV
ncbi:MAG: methyl-accepting chemotaxis protein [Bacteroides sp.]|nr:methyl-accepting chemotaxis protein [Prevotella sp.]MCM1470825.1 methyl-accepting chemotaxis protein [Bacteroides sp.]